MSVSNVREFLAKVRSDAALQERFQKLYAAKDVPGLAAMSNELGFAISREDYEAAVREDLKKLADSGKLSEEDLKAIAGGAGGGGLTIGPACLPTLGDACPQFTSKATGCGTPEGSVGFPQCSQVTCA